MRLISTIALFTCAFLQARCAAQQVAAPAFVLDQYTPAPLVAARADSLQDLIAQTKPTIIWKSSWLWAKPAQHNAVAFTIGSPQWVKDARHQTFWALLRHANPDLTERDHDGLVTSDVGDRVLRDIPLVEKKPISDSGSGDYARIITRRNDQELYEIGLEFESYGSGHDTTERRLYVLHGAKDRWQFIGEGPAETSGKAGCLCEGFSADTIASLSGSPRSPATIHFSTTDCSMLAGEAVEPAFPDLEIHRDAILDGPPPATFHWVSDPFIAALPHDTFQKIIDRYVYWEIQLTDDEMDEPQKQLAATFAKLVRDRNPSLLDRELPSGTPVFLPSPREIQRNVK